MSWFDLLVGEGGFFDDCDIVLMGLVIGDNGVIMLVKLDGQKMWVVGKGRNGGVIMLVLDVEQLLVVLLQSLMVLDVQEIWEIIVFDKIFNVVLVCWVSKVGW